MITEQSYKAQSKIPNTGRTGPGSPPTSPPKKNTEKHTDVHTLAQLRKAPPKTPPLLQSANLKKRAKSKHFSNELSLALVDTKSELNQPYWNTWHCNSVLDQNGRTITGRYCKNRWCNTCNRIRTAKLIRGYTKPLKELKDLHFVTLTVPNVKASALKTTIEDMKVEFKRIGDTLRKRGTPIIGLRKIECTYNATENTYHPHFHVGLSGEAVAMELVKEWLLRFPETSSKGQDVREADSNAVQELFKYFTKMVTYSKTDETRKIYPKALDVIFRAMVRQRVFQPLGIKMVSEEIEEIQSKDYDIEEKNTTWQWENEDWVDVNTGEFLTDYKPSAGVVQLLRNIAKAPPE